MGRRHILHCDMNCFYASVEMQRHPELRNTPLAVCGSQEERHGIVLTANYIAKPYGVKTGMAIWQEKQRCHDLVTLPPDMDEYISKIAVSVIVVIVNYVFSKLFIFRKSEEKSL